MSWTIAAVAHVGIVWPVMRILPYQNALGTVVADKILVLGFLKIFNPE